MSQPQISFVIPAFNEEASIPILCERIETNVAALLLTYEVIIVNDGSTDGSEAVFEALADHDARIRIITFSRNFGKEAALLAGLSAADGECALIMDADLQHPPELISAMVKAWLNGGEVVNAVKRQRGNESFAYKLMAGTFNRVMSSAIGTDMSSASDFKLLDRQVVDAVLGCPERNRFFRGLVAWMGFRVEEIEFDVASRYGGETKWSPMSLVRYTLTNLVSFSSFPLKLVAYVGFATVAVGGVLLLQTLWRYFSGTAAIGFTTVIAIQVLIGGMIIFSIGVVSIYLAYMYDEQKQRPVFIAKRGSRARVASSRVFGRPGGVSPGSVSEFSRSGSDE